MRYQALSHMGFVVDRAALGQGFSPGLLVPQSFDWLAAFHLDLLQAILSSAV